MTQEEIIKITKTNYIIDWVCPIDAYGKQSFYFELVRKSDMAILYSNEKLENVEVRCWQLGIDHKDVTIW